MNKKAKKNITTHDVAKLAGVSQSTVSRVFSDDKSVSSENKEKVNNAAKELGYRMNYTAQGLSSPKSRLVGVVVSHLETSTRARQTRFITEKLLENKYHPILLSVEKPHMQENVLEDLLGYNLSGIIITSGHIPTKIIDECAALDIPIVALYNDTDLAEVDHVALDVEHMGKLAFDMLYSCGVRKMGLIRVNGFSHTLSKRAEYFIKTCDEVGVPCHVFDSTKNSHSVGKEFSHAIYENIENIDGIFCSNDVIAMGVIDGLKYFGIEVPKDIQVLGFEDIPAAEWGRYELSTIKLKLKESSIKAVDILLERMENPDKEYEIHYASIASVFRSTTQSR